MDAIYNISFLSNTIIYEVIISHHKSIANNPITGFALGLKLLYFVFYKLQSNYGRPGAGNPTAVHCTTIIYNSSLIVQMRKGQSRIMFTINYLGDISLTAMLFLTDLVTINFVFHQ